MSELLSEQELREALKQCFEPALKDLVDYDEAVALIQSQKLAHGEMVIGEDEPGDYLTYNATKTYVGCRNDFRAEMRERNKLSENSGAVLVVEGKK